MRQTSNTKGQRMTPDLALEILDKATAQLSMTRADHISIVNALEVLRKVVKTSKDTVIVEEPN